MGKSDAGRPRGTQPAVPDEPAGVQSLCAQGKPGAAVELPLRRSHDQLPAEVDGPTQMAAAEAMREARRDVAEASGRHRELLPNQCSSRGGGSRQFNGNIRMLINRGRGYKN